MSLTPYIKDSAFFQNLRDRNMTIAYGDLDDSFNNLVSYINNNIAPVVDILFSQEYVGIKGNSTSFLRNKGDGTTIFDIIRKTDIPNNSLTLDKFELLKANSVLASNNNGILGAVAITSNNQVLISRSLNSPQWEKINNNCFQDNSIEKEKVGIEALSARHLAPNIIGRPLSENSIENPYIQNGTIPNTKINNGALTSTKLNDLLLASRMGAADLIFKERCFSGRTIVDNSVNIIDAITKYLVNQNRRRILPPSCIPLNAVTLDTTSFKINARTQMDGFITPNKIKNESLDLPEIMSRANLSVSNSPVNPFTGIVSQSKPINKNQLSLEFKNILVTKGGLTP